MMTPYFKKKNNKKLYPPTRLKSNETVHLPNKDPIGLSQQQIKKRC